MLRHAVHDPATVGRWLAGDLFDDPLHWGVLRALLESDTTEAAVAGAEPAVAGLLRRLLVEPPTSDSFDAVRLLLGQVIQRELRLLNASVAEDPTDVLRQTMTLRSLLTGINDRELATATESADRLLAWLRQRVGDGG